MTITQHLLSEIYKLRETSCEIMMLRSQASGRAARVLLLCARKDWCT